MVIANNIHKFYGDLEVLKGVDIHVRKKEILSIMGVSGAGKTTLLQILGTLDSMSEPFGSIQISDTDISTLNSKQIARFRNKNIGFIFQFHQLLPEFTALENVCIPAFIGGESKSNTEKYAKDLLDYLGLGDRINHKPSKMSGGEQQRVAVARSLINHPKVIFADEPSGNLDSQSADTLHQLFLKLRDEFSQTFIIVTHSEKLAAMADRTIHMKDGKIIR